MQSRTRRVRLALPQGHALPDDVWRRRHRGILILVALHLPVLLAVALFEGRGPGHGTLDLVPIAGLGLLATRLPGRRWPTLAASAALLLCSAVLVHLTDGLAEAHFHFFVVLTVLAFYEDWTAYGMALTFVLLHHGLVGTGLPYRVFDHPNAEDGLQALRWAAVHGLFIGSSAAANLLLWRANERSRVRAAVLARSLTPGEVPELSGARAAARHVPSDGDAGGDWLDVVTLPCGRILVTLGDVTGHGPAAAGCSARLRYTARAYAEDGWSPAAVLERLDRCVERVSATALVAVIDTRAETLTLARAGHLPPVLRLPDGSTRILDEGGGPMLANFGLPHSERTVPFPAGATLVTCSDGLVERRGECIDVGLARLRDAVDRSTGVPADLALAVPAALVTGDADDDVALVAVQSAAPEQPVAVAR